MPVLHVIPIVHTAAELGKLCSAIRQPAEVNEDSSATQQRIETIGHFWELLRQAVLNWKIDFNKTRIYQDALPVMDERHQVVLEKIVAELAEKGSPNHKMLCWLREQGAQLMGTESAALLREEYALVKQAVTDQVNSVDASGRSSSRADDNHYEVLLEKRDRFIAERIVDTLQQTETGLLFIGMLHSVETFLPDSIVVQYPFGKPSRESLRVRRLKIQS